MDISYYFYLIDFVFYYQGIKKLEIPHSPPLTLPASRDADLASLFVTLDLFCAFF